MGAPRSARAGRRYRRARRLDRNARGVAAVVGTLLALLVFFALFGIFLTEYLPVWMSSNESQFTAQAIASLATFKSNVDSQYALGGPPLYSTQFPLSSQGVPLLAQPTEATLSLLPPACPSSFYSSNGTPEVVSACVFERQAFTAGAAAKTNVPWNETTVGALLEMQLPNRYFSAQTFYFEDDAIVQSQGGGHAAMIGPPPLTVTKSGSNVSLTTDYVELYGNSTVVIGQGSEEVYSQLLTAQTTSSLDRFHSSTGAAVPFNYTFQVGTRNPCAWFYYFTNLTAASGLSAYTSGTGPGWTLTWASGGTTSYSTAPTATVCLDSNSVTYLVTLKVFNITYATVTVSALLVSLGAGVA